MSKSDNPISCRVDDDLAGKIDDYQTRAGFDNRSDALEDLLRTGLRESRSPILARWREKCIEWAGLLGVFAMVFLAGGVATPAVTARTGYLMSIVLIAIGIGLLGMLELARLFTGQSAIASAIHEVIG